MGSTLRAKMTSKVTIPKAVRDRLGLGPGDTLVFDLEDGRTGARAERRKTIADFAGLFLVKKALPPHKVRARAWESETRRLTRPRGSGR